MVKVYLRFRNGYFTLVLLLLAISLLSACSDYQRAGALTMREVLEKGVYDTELKVYGTVNKLGEAPGTYFILTSGNRDLSAYYANMVNDDGSRWRTIAIDGIHNGDEVLAVGQLKSAGKYRSQNSFWIKTINVLRPAVVRE